MLQENVQQQLAKVLNTKNNTNNVNLINNISLKNDRDNQRNVVSDPLLSEQKCAPKAWNSCEQIPVGNNLALQIHKENTSEKTCLIREISNTATSGSSKEEKVNFVSGGKVKTTNEITDGVDKLNLNGLSSKCGNELKGATASSTKNMIINEDETTVIKVATTPTSHQNRSTLNQIYSVRKKETEHDERSLNHSNRSHGIDIYSKSRKHSSRKHPAIKNQTTNKQSTKCLTGLVELSPKPTVPYQSPTLTDRYLKTLARCSAASDGKADLQTILQRQRVKSESNLLQFPETARRLYGDEMKKTIAAEERCSNSNGSLRRIGSTESISTQVDEINYSPAFHSLRNHSIEPLTAFSIPKRCNSEDNLSVFSGRYDLVDVSSTQTMNQITNNNGIPSAIVKAQPAVVREEEADSLSYIYDNVNEMEYQYQNDELYESIAGSTSDLSLTPERNELASNDISSSRYSESSKRNGSNRYIRNKSLSNATKTSFSSSTASSFSR